MSVVTYQRGDTTALSKNFTRDEFECQCGKCTAQMIDTELVDKLQRIRDVPVSYTHLTLPTTFVV